MNTVEYILKKFNLNSNQKSPIQIPNTDRQTLAILFKELGFNTGVEIGVQEGIYSEMLLQANSELKLHGVDPWTFYDSAGFFRRQRHLNRHYNAAVKRLTPYENYTFVKKLSMDAVKDFEDDSLDFVYIDANHEYLHVVQDIFEWSKKVKKGGVISGHDYYRSLDKNTRLHVLYVLHGYTEAYKIKPWFVLGRKEKIEGELRDKARSWFWVKQ